MQSSGEPAETTDSLSAPESVTNLIPAEIRDLFDDPPLIPGESRQKYEQLFTELVVNVEPKSIIEWIWVRDIQDLVWEGKRLRRLKAALLKNATYISSEHVFGNNLEEFMNDGDSYSKPRSWGRQLAIGWSKPDSDTTRTLKAHLAKLGIDLETVITTALVNKLPEIERIERMIASNEKRRDDVIKEIERSRDQLAKRIKQQADHHVEDIEIETDPPTGMVLQ